MKPNHAPREPPPEKSVVKNKIWGLPDPLTETSAATLRRKATHPRPRPAGPEHSHRPGQIVTGCGGATGN
eukprot:9352397-Lingulodinium_polyedra.AAC.1